MNVVLDKLSGHSAPKNMFSKYLKQMSEQDLQDLNDELRRLVQARLRKTVKPKEADIAHPEDLFQNLSFILSSDKLLKSLLPTVRNFFEDAGKSDEVSFEQWNFEN